MNADHNQFGQSTSDPMKAMPAQWLAWPRKPLSKPKGGESGAKSAGRANRAVNRGKSGRGRKKS